MNKKCTICPNQCNVDRKLTVGRCQVKEDFQIAKYGLHPYEEPPISYKNGSGTIFFTDARLDASFVKTIRYPTHYKQKKLH